MFKKQKLNYGIKGMFLVLMFCLVANAQTINVTGIVTDSVSAQGILNAKVRFIQFPQCTTRTVANGSFTLAGTGTIIKGLTPHVSPLTDQISLRGNALTLKNIRSSSPVLIDVFTINGSRIFHAEKSVSADGSVTVNNLWKTSGIYFVKIQIDDNKYVISGFGTNREAIFPSFLMSQGENSYAKSNATYTLEITANGYATKWISMTSTVGNAGIIRMSVPKIVGVGTGTTFAPQYVTTVTGGGPMPSAADADVITANCDGTGSADATACLQAAATAARDAKKSLVIPYTPGYYKIIRPITVYTSVIGTGPDRPTIKQTSTCGTVNCAGIQLSANMTGWIYNLHIVGTYESSASGEHAPNIRINGANGITIKGCLLENPQGDNIYDGGMNPSSRNIFIDNNTMNNPRRCNLAMVAVSDKWAVMNNVMFSKAGYVDPIDFEPNNDACSLTNIEVAYNKITYTGPNQQYCHVIFDVDSYFDHTPGGNIYRHHNYGTWSLPFAGGGASPWTNVVTLKNVQGNSPPQ